MSFEDLRIKTENWKAMKFWQSYRELSPKPRLSLAIITCMDCRIISDIFGLAVGDAIVIRSAGNRITTDTIRSLLLAVYELRVQRILICGHTNCGAIISTKRAETILQKAAAESNMPVEQLIQDLNGKDSWSALGAIDDVYANVRVGLDTLLQSHLFPDCIQVIGAVYHVETGEIEFLSS